MKAVNIEKVIVLQMYKKPDTRVTVQWQIFTDTPMIETSEIVFMYAFIIQTKKSNV